MIIQVVPDEQKLFLCNVFFSLSFFFLSFFYFIISYRSARSVPAVDTPELLEIACVSSLELRLPGTSNVYEIESKILANGDREKATWGKHGHLGYFP